MWGVSFISLRYFFSKKKKNFVNVISLISMMGVAVGSMSLIIVLSVFNGLEGLIRSLYGSFDPDIKVEVLYGKTFSLDSVSVKSIAAIAGVEEVTEVIEDNVLLKYGENRQVVKMKGVGANFSRQNKIDSMMVSGEFALYHGQRPQLVAGRGVQYRLGITLSNTLPIQCWYPKHSLGASLNPEKSFNKALIYPVGAFAIEQKYDDNYVFVPLEFAEQLMQIRHRRSALEVKVSDEYRVSEVQREIKNMLGADYRVLNSDEQHVGLLKAVKIEKLIVFLIFSFIIAIASINIFFSLSMLAIEKKHDLSILFAMGAHRAFVRNIFLGVGLIINVIGTSLGLFVGFAICALQQKFGFVSMGMATSVVDAYPVKMVPADFIVTALTMFLITAGASIFPAWRAGDSVLKANLK